MFVGRLDVGDRYDAVLVEPEHLVVGDWVKASIDRAQLDLQKAVELQQQALLDVVVQAPYREVFPVLQLGYTLWILESNLLSFWFSLFCLNHDQIILCWSSIKLYIYLVMPKRIFVLFCSSFVDIETSEA